MLWTSGCGKAHNYFYFYSVGSASKGWCDVYTGALMCSLHDHWGWWNTGLVSVQQSGTLSVSHLVLCRYHPQGFLLASKQIWSNFFCFFTLVKKAFNNHLSSFEVSCIYSISCFRLSLSHSFRTQWHFSFHVHLRQNFFFFFPVENRIGW